VTRRPSAHRVRGSAGFTLVEILIAVAITAMLGLAIAAALRASLMAYGTTARSSSANASARMVMQQTMGLIRTANLHDAYDPNDSGVTLLAPTHPDHPLRTVGVRMFLNDGREIRIWWASAGVDGQPDLGDLWYEQVGSDAQQLADNVICRRTEAGDPYVFTLASRTSETGLLLARATLELTVQPDPESGTNIEQNTARTGRITLVGSTMPRRNLD